MRATLNRSSRRLTNETNGPAQLAGLFAGLSQALDLAEYRPRGHAQRTAVIGLRLAEALGLNDAATRASLYFALLLKDAGCTSNAARMFEILSSEEISGDSSKPIDWRSVTWESVAAAATDAGAGEAWWRRMLGGLGGGLPGGKAKPKNRQRELRRIRSERGAAIAVELGLPVDTVAAIRHIEEEWTGGGAPDGLAGPAIPLLARIVNVAQTLEILTHQKGARGAADAVGARAGHALDPDIATLGARLIQGYDLLDEMAEAPKFLLRHAPADPVDCPLDHRVNEICRAFAGVVDAKSPFTSRHSLGVADAAVAIGRGLGLAAEELQALERGGWLHDIGKLAVPSEIIEKPGRLTNTEWKVVQEHPRIGEEILARIPGFGKIAELAGTHHERLDGSGYYRGLDAAAQSLRIRIMAVADAFDALAADRPYRAGLPLDQVYQLLREEPLDADCVAALEASRQPDASPNGDLRRLRESVDDSRSV